MPLYVHTNAIANPTVNPGQLTGYLFEGDICWTQSVSAVCRFPAYLCRDINYIFPQFWLQLFPLDIPANATYVGDKTINGTACSVWTWNPYESYYIDVCIPLPRLISTQPCTDVGEQEDHPLR